MTADLDIRPPIPEVRQATIIGMVAIDEQQINGSDLRILGMLGIAYDGTDIVADV